MSRTGETPEQAAARRSVDRAFPAVAAFLASEDVRPDADLMRADAPQVSRTKGSPVNTRDLKLVNGCPKWCTDDHTEQAAEDREHHNGTVRELRLPDGRLALEASLTLELGTPTPRLVISGSVDSFTDDVQLLGLADAKAFEAEVQRFAAHVTRMTATLRATEAQQPRPKKPNPGQRARSAWRETRLYLAERDGRHCFYCRTPFDTLKGVTIDHYVPKSVWACNLPANLVLACRSCNLSKGDRLTWPMAAVLLAWQRGQRGAVAEAA